MEWIDGLDRAMGYIEESLRGEVDLAGAARHAACSRFHLQRMFPYMTGMTLPDYVRRRRVSLAALDLAAGDKVIDVALRYGCERPTSFARAFCDVRGVAPSGARRGEAQAAPAPRLHDAGERGRGNGVPHRGEARHARGGAPAGG